MSVAPDRRKLVSAATAARVLGVHPETVRRWIKTGALAGVTVGTVPPRKKPRYFAFRDALETLCGVHHRGQS